MISIVICTYNRCAGLQRTLDSVAALEIPAGFEWELIVVDNNSPDATRLTVESYARDSGMPVRYIFEENQGLSHARNRGIDEALGDVIAFTDDDVLVEPDWLFNISRIMADKDIASAGGKIFPVWEVGPPPSWLTVELHDMLALQDCGDDLIELEISSPRGIFGANFIIRKEMFQKYGSFDTGIGRTSGKLYAGEETLLLERLIKGGERVVYHPDLVVHHCIPAHRMEKAYFRKWKRDQGELYGKNLLLRGINKVPCWVYRSLVKQIILFVLRRVVDPHRCFIHELRVVGLLGVLSGARSAKR